MTQALWPRLLNPSERPGSSGRVATAKAAAEWPLCEAAAPHVGHPGSPVHAAHRQCHHHGAQQSSEQEARTGKAGCDEHARDEEHW